MVNFSDITTENRHRITEDADWERHGVKRLPKLIPDDLIDAYVAERTKLIGGTALWGSGWKHPTPYMEVGSMRDLALYRPLTEAMRSLLFGEEPGLHLCLTGFKSTERAWHQDSYLNPEGVGERYIAAWIALDDVHPDSGPFEYVPGSHTWPVIERRKVWNSHEKMGEKIDPHTWPSDTQGWVGRACEREIAARGVSPVPFLAKRGDVLLWHASLVHRGSKPKNPNLERRALICHYSGIGARPDMLAPVKRSDGSWYFPF